MVVHLPLNTTPLRSFLLLSDSLPMAETSLSSLTPSYSSVLFNWFAACPPRQLHLSSDIGLGMAFSTSIALLKRIQEQSLIEK